MPYFYGLTGILFFTMNLCMRNEASHISLMAHSNEMHKSQGIIGNTSQPLQCGQPSKETFLRRSRVLEISNLLFSRMREH